LLLIKGFDTMMLVGKFIVAYVPSCREKEYYIASACDEIYAPPSAYFSLFGLTVQASFLRGKLIILLLAFSRQRFALGSWCSRLY